MSVRIDLAQGILDDNDLIAMATSERLHSAHVLCVGLLSSPGAGKTTLLEATARAWSDPTRLGVIVGDVATEVDSARLRACRMPAVQINTASHGASCHLSAGPVAEALDAFDLPRLDVLFIENVGNLVCPVAFRLGEHYRSVLLSVTEGPDKPVKYPKAILDTDLAVITKADLCPHVDVPAAEVEQNVRRVRPDARVLTVSARGEPGVGAWLGWLDEMLAAMCCTK